MRLLSLACLQQNVCCLGKCSFRMCLIFADSFVSMMSVYLGLIVLMQQDVVRTNVV